MKALSLFDSCFKSGPITNWKKLRTPSCPTKSFKNQGSRGVNVAAEDEPISARRGVQKKNKKILLQIRTYMCNTLRGRIRVLFVRIGGSVSGAQIQGGKRAVSSVTEFLV